MITSDFLRRTAFGAAGILRAGVPATFCRFKSQDDTGDQWQKEAWGLRAYRTPAQGWVPFARTDFTGRFICHLLIREIPVEYLADVLAANGLSLPSTSAATHPVILMMGRQQGVRQIVWPESVVMNYHELIIAFRKSGFATV